MISSWVLIIAKWPLRLGIQGTYKSRATTPFVNDITWLLMMWITLCGIMFILVNEHVFCDVGIIELIVEQACWNYYDYRFHCQSCCSMFMHVWFNSHARDGLIICMLLYGMSSILWAIYSYLVVLFILPHVKG